MHNILTLTLNPAIDFNIILPDTLSIGKVNRAVKSFKTAGGKGINVASYLSDMGLKNITVTGYLGIENAHYFKEHFTNKDLLDQFIYYHGYTRENVKIVENKVSITTDINLESSYINKPSIQQLEDLIENTSYQKDYYLFSGSVPKWIDNSIYLKLGKILKEKNKKIIIDSSGIPLKMALELPPFAIKPNLDEFYELYGYTSDIKNILKNIDMLLNSGIEYVLLSMGSNGAILATKYGKIKAKGNLSRLVTSVGAGDAFLSGFIYGIINNYHLKDLAIFSTASSLALLESPNRSVPGAQSIYNNYYKNITLEEIKTY
jgi:1-phosphofructokinase family hexose kinase